MQSVCGVRSNYIYYVIVCIVRSGPTFAHINSVSSESTVLLRAHFVLILTAGALNLTNRMLNQVLTWGHDYVCEKLFWVNY